MAFSEHITVVIRAEGYDGPELSHGIERPQDITPKEKVACPSDQTDAQERSTLNSLKPTGVYSSLQRDRLQ